jgi:hypothetical protein
VPIIVQRRVGGTLWDVSRSEGTFCKAIERLWRAFYDWLAETIRIDGIVNVQRDTAFDDERYRSGGVRLNYKSITDSVPGLKDGVLLEVGFDDVTPNVAKDISS